MIKQLHYIQALVFIFCTRSTRSVEVHVKEAQFIKNDFNDQQERFFFFRGITFDRTVEHVADGMNIQLAFDQEHCDQADDFGDTHCKFHWGDHMDGILTSEHLPEELDDSYQVQGSFMVDASVALDFECNVCGSPCTLTVPVIDQTVTVDFPSCPIPKDGFSQEISVLLPPEAYIPETIISGSVSIIKKTQGKVTPLFTANATIKIHW